MKCPYCPSPASRVLETRAAAGNLSIRRRRVCLKCGERFTTAESLDTSPAVVIAEDGTRSPFSRKRLADSLLLGGRRSVDEATREAIVESVVAALYARGPAVHAQEVAEVALDVLKNHDVLTLVRYALSVRRPEGLNDFQTWMSSLGNASSVQVPTLLVSKRNGSLEPFDNRKLVRSIEHASRNRVSLDAATCRELAGSVREAAHTKYRDSDSSISSREIGEMVLTALGEIDSVASLSYATLFYGLDTFDKVNAEVARLKSRPNQKKRIASAHA